MKKHIIILLAAMVLLALATCITPLMVNATTPTLTVINPSSGPYYVGNPIEMQIVYPTSIPEAYEIEFTSYSPTGTLSSGSYWVPMTYISDAGGCTFSFTYTPEQSGQSSFNYDINLYPAPATDQGTVNGPMIVSAATPTPTPTPTPAPIASISMPTTGTVGQPVSFIDLSGGEITTWSWNFGDGGTSTSENPPAHTYTTPGGYTVTLTVSNPDGSNTTTRYILIDPASTPTPTVIPPTPTPTVIPPTPTPTVIPPTAYFTMPSTGFVGQPVSFLDRSTGGATSWSWNFGDGGTSTSENPTHTYSTPGTYTVTFTASNTVGSDMGEGSITIDPVPTSTPTVVPPTSTPTVVSSTPMPTLNSTPTLIPMLSGSSPAPTALPAASPSPTPVPFVGGIEAISSIVLGAGLYMMIRRKKD